MYWRLHIHRRGKGVGFIVADIWWSAGRGRLCATRKEYGKDVSLVRLKKECRPRPNRIEKSLWIDFGAICFLFRLICRKMSQANVTYATHSQQNNISMCRQSISAVFLEGTWLGFKSQQWSRSFFYSSLPCPCYPVFREGGRCRCGCWSVLFLMRSFIYPPPIPFPFWMIWFLDMAVQM